MFISLLVFLGTGRSTHLILLCCMWTNSFSEINLLHMLLLCFHKITCPNQVSLRSSGHMHIYVLYIRSPVIEYEMQIEQEHDKVCVVLPLEPLTDTCTRLPTYQKAGCPSPPPSDLIQLSFKWYLTELLIPESPNVQLMSNGHFFKQSFSSCQSCLCVTFRLTTYEAVYALIASKGSTSI